MSDKIKVPGQNVLGNNKITPVFPSPIPGLEIPFGNEENFKGHLLSPFVLAYKLNEGIDIELMAFISAKYDLTSKNFSIYYDYTFETGAVYQLLIYLSFNTDSVNPNKEGLWRLYPGGIFFNKDSITDSNNEPISFDKVSTVKVFLIQEDPGTSRGTETTVQQGGG